MTSVLLSSENPLLSPYASADFNSWFWYELKYLANDVATVLGDDLVALVLGGGFGRGEGCVTTVDGEERPYNDVDLFLVTQTRSPKGLKKLKHVAERYESRLGIAVDFSRPQTFSMIARWEPLLMWQELLNGHIVLIGSESVLTSNVDSSLHQTLPVIEASRMMLNRGAGLLWAARVLQNLDSAPDNSFVQRNYYKCCQALGDAALIASRCYTSSPARKISLVHELPDVHPIVGRLEIPALLTEAFAFRRSPADCRSITLADTHVLAARWISLFLWLENSRLELDMESIGEYTDWKGLREPGNQGVLPGLAANLRRARFRLQHPRETVYRALPNSLLAFVNSQVNFPELSAGALQLWREAA